MNVAMDDERVPSMVRESVRRGIFEAIQQDVELRGGRTAHLLLMAAALGVAGAVGVTALVSGHPFDHQPPWHVTVVSSVWAGLLFVSFAVVLLGVRTPRLQLAKSAAVGILGLGVAGLCGVACPDPHFLSWWSTTSVGDAAARAGGLAPSAFCLGLLSTAGFATVAAFVVLGPAGWDRSTRLLSAAFLVLLLLPGVALQSVETSWLTFAAWAFGTGAGSIVGVGLGHHARARLAAQ